MDNKNKDFGKDLLNNLDQQREEAVAGAQIEATEEQRMEAYGAKAAAVKAENEAELNGEAQIGATMAGRRPISEAEAKALLMEETQKTEKKLAKAHKNNKKIAIIAVVVAVVLCAAGLALAFMMGNNGDESNDTEKNDTPVVDGGEEKPEEPEDEIVALDVNDPLVQRLYGNFDVANGQVYGIEEVFQGKIPDDFMMSVARLNVPGVACKLEPADEVLEERYGSEAIQMWGLDEIRQASQLCYSGTATLEKVQEIFGKSFTLEDGVLTGSFTPGGQPHYKYDKANDEFYYYMMPGGGIGPGIVHALYAAEKDGDSVYLYDVAGLLYEGYLADGRTYAIPFDESLINEGTDEKKAEYAIDYDLNDETILLHKDDFSKFKWIFVKNDSGEYVFTGLEKVE